jgi:hypothetical protein
LGRFVKFVNSQFADLRWFVRNERYPVPGSVHCPDARQSPGKFHKCRSEITGRWRKPEDSSC